MHAVTRRLTTMIVGASLMTAGLASIGAAQDPSGSPSVPQTCGVLTADEVTAALGITVTVDTGGDTDCAFYSDFSGGTYVSLNTSRDSGDLEGIRTVMCSSFIASPTPTVAPDCAIDVTVGGLPAIYLPESMGTLLYVQTTADGMFTLQLVGDPAAGVDKQAAVTGLAELALPRLAEFPEPTPEPGEVQPSITPDKDLEALFPTEIGGTTVLVQSYTGAALAATGNVPQEFLSALAAVGKSIEDVSIGQGYVITPSGGAGSSIVAFKVKGADMPALKATLLPILTAGQDLGAETPVQVAGKDVTTATVSGNANYLYPKDDVLWVVTAVEPALTEIFQKLP